MIISQCRKSLEEQLFSLLLGKATRLFAARRHSTKQQNSDASAFNGDGDTTRQVANIAIESLR